MKYLTNLKFYTGYSINYMYMYYTIYVKMMILQVNKYKLYHTSRLILC